MGHIEDAIALLAAASQLLEGAAGTAGQGMSDASNAAASMGAANQQVEEAVSYMSQVGGGMEAGVGILETAHSEAISALNIAAGLIDEFSSEAIRVAAQCTEKAQALTASGGKS